MKKQNNALVAVLVVVIVLAIAVASAIIYFTTDLFKSNKEIFNKYAAQSFTNIENFIGPEVIAYNTKMLQTPFINNGKAEMKDLSNSSNSASTTSSDSSSAYKVDFNGKVDNPNKKAEITGNVTMGTYNFPIQFKREGDYFGIKSSNLISQYLTIKNDNLKDLLKKFGLKDEDLKYVPNKIESIPVLTEAQKKDISARYSKILKNIFDKSKYTKVNSNTVKLSLTEEDIKNLGLALLAELKNDKILLTNSKDWIASVEDALKNQQVENKQVDVVVTKAKGKVTKIALVNPEDTNTTVELSFDNGKITFRSNVKGSSISNTESSLGNSFSSLNESTKNSQASDDQDKYKETVVTFEKAVNATDVAFTINSEEKTEGTSKATKSTSLYTYSGIKTDTVKETSKTTENSTSSTGTSTTYETTYENNVTFGGTVTIDNELSDSSKSYIINDKSTDELSQTATAIMLKFYQSIGFGSLYGSSSSLYGNSYSNGSYGSSYGNSSYGDSGLSDYSSMY